MNTEVKETKKQAFKGVKPANNKGGRPRKYVAKTGITKETRVPVEGLRDILTVEGKDPNFHYYWELDSDETGTNIYKRLRAGYEFVQADTVIVGQANVYKSSNVGTIVRVPNPDGRYLYLMRIPKDWHEDDLKAQELRNKESEQSIYEDANQSGRYGSVKLTRE